MAINHTCAEHSGGKTNSSDRALEDPKGVQVQDNGCVTSRHLCSFVPAYNDIPQKIAPFRSTLLRERQRVCSLRLSRWPGLEIPTRSASPPPTDPIELLMRCMPRENGRHVSITPRPLVRPVHALPEHWIPAVPAPTTRHRVALQQRQGTVYLSAFSGIVPIEWSTTSAPTSAEGVRRHDHPPVRGSASWGHGTHDMCPRRPPLPLGHSVFLFPLARSDRNRHRPNAASGRWKNPGA